MTKTTESFWAEFREQNPDVPSDESYQVWYFGNTRELAAELAGLVVAGRKTATASQTSVDEVNPQDAPRPDGYSVITTFDGEPICVIRTTEIRHIPFDAVDPQFAADEGEGDLSYEHWRRVHWDYFSAEAARLGLKFDERSTITCERFELLYPR